MTPGASVRPGHGLLGSGEVLQLNRPHCRKLGGGGGVDDLPYIRVLLKLQSLHNYQ